MVQWRLMPWKGEAEFAISVLLSWMRFCRSVKEISLSSLLIVVILRLAQLSVVFAASEWLLSLGRQCKSYLITHYLLHHCTIHTLHFTGWCSVAPHLTSMILDHNRHSLCLSLSQSCLVHFVPAAGTLELRSLPRLAAISVKSGRIVAARDHLDASWCSVLSACPHSQIPTIQFGYVWLCLVWFSESSLTKRPHWWSLIILHPLPCLMATCSTSCPGLRFFNRTVAAILGNLAAHGVEHVHWHTANRMLEVGICQMCPILADKMDQNSIAWADISIGELFWATRKHRGLSDFRLKMCQPQTSVYTLYIYIMGYALFLWCAWYA